MRILLLLLAFMALTETKPADEVLLKEIMDSVREIQNWKDADSQKILNQYVKEVILPASCSDKTLCQAAVVLKDTNFKHSMLLRRLFAYAGYTGHRNCSVSASEEYTMKELLGQIEKCSQERYTHLVKLKKHVQ